MIANFRSFGYYTNSLCQYQRKRLARVWKTWTLILWCKGLRRPQSLSKRLGTLLKNTNKLHTSSPLSTFLGISICLVIIWVHRHHVTSLVHQGSTSKVVKVFPLIDLPTTGQKVGGGGGEVQQKATRLKRSFHASTTPLLKGYRKRLNTSGQPNTASLLMKFLFQKVLLLNSHWHDRNINLLIKKQWFLSALLHTVHNLTFFRRIFKMKCELICFYNSDLIMNEGWMKRNRNYEPKPNCSHVNDKRRGIKEKKKNDKNKIKNDQRTPDSFHKIISTCSYLPSEIQISCKSYMLWSIIIITNI